MKKVWQVLVLVVCATVLAVPAWAQKNGGIFDDENPNPNFASSRRLDELSQQLARQAEEISDAVYSDYTRNNNNNNGGRGNRGGFGNRNNLQQVFDAQQLNAHADLFYKMVRDRRSTGDLRQAANLLQDSFRRANTNSSRNRWNEAQRTLDDISRELNNGGSGNGGGGNGGGYGGPGRLTWRGTVDDLVQLRVRDNYLETRTLSGTEYNNANYNFTGNRLPRQRVNLSVNMTRGRGNVNIVEQPSQFNDWTAVVEIRDARGGADDYVIELVWQ